MSEEELCVYRDTLNGGAAVPLKVARLAAIATLLTAPDDLAAGLEAELYAFRDDVTGSPAPDSGGEKRLWRFSALT